MHQMEYIDGDVKRAKQHLTSLHVVSPLWIDEYILLLSDYFRHASPCICISARVLSFMTGIDAVKKVHVRPKLDFVSFYQMMTHPRYLCLLHCDIVIYLYTHTHGCDTSQKKKRDMRPKRGALIGKSAKELSSSQPGWYH
jgi:hypothetical protein